MDGNRCFRLLQVLRLVSYFCPAALRTGKSKSLKADGRRGDPADSSARNIKDVQFQAVLEVIAFGTSTVESIFRWFPEWIAPASMIPLQDVDLNMSTVKLKKGVSKVS